MANTLLIRKALTNAVMKAKIKQARAERADERVDGVSFASSLSVCWVTTSTLVGQRGLERLLDVVVLGAVGDLQVDAVVHALGTEHGGGASAGRRGPPMAPPKPSLSPRPMSPTT